MPWLHGAPPVRDIYEPRLEKIDISVQNARPRSNPTCSDSSARASSSKACPIDFRRRDAQYHPALSSSLLARSNSTAISRITPSSPLTFLIFKIVRIRPIEATVAYPEYREQRKSECAEGLPKSESRSGTPAIFADPALVSPDAAAAESRADWRGSRGAPPIAKVGCASQKPDQTTKRHPSENDAGDPDDE